MPAWGVRTALTALRTFMAEKGTAGQVGGLEASKEVRQRLARESRLWRCDGCGNQGRTNEEVMKEWWVVCREKGVKVGEDGEEVGLELLPEGMNLEARDPNQQKGKEQSGDSISSSTDDRVAEDTKATAAALSSAIASSIDGVNAQSEKHNGISTAVRTPMPENISDLHQLPQTIPPSQPTHRQTPSASSIVAPIPQASSTRMGVAEGIAADPANTTTIDRAIGALVLALCLMLLKKIFYPATTPSLDEYYLPDG